jgi:hypothetical protein
LLPKSANLARSDWGSVPDPLFGVAAMQHRVTTLPVQLPADELDRPSPSHPPLPGAPGETPVIGSARKARRDRSDLQLDADFEEICRLIGERFARTGVLDPEFCRFVGLLPDLRNVKDRALVREAKIIAAYLGRDDIEPGTAQRVISGLADRLGPLSGVPALNVMFGVLLFFGALLAIDLILSYFWQTAGWNLAAAAQYPGFYVFNVSPWLIIAVGTAGGLGSIVSILTRIPSFAALAGTDRRLLWMIGAMRPVIGIAFALFIFAVLQAQILPFNFPDGPQANFEFVALAFIAGFSERLSRGVISTVEGRFIGTKPE